VFGEQILIIGAPKGGGGKNHSAWVTGALTQRRRGNKRGSFRFIIGGTEGTKNRKTTGTIIFRERNWSHPGQLAAYDENAV